MNRLPGCLIFLLFVQPLNAQSFDSAAKNLIFLSPFKLLDPVNSGVEWSYEKAHNTRWATHIAATYGLQITGVDRNVSGYRLQVEQKYFYRTTAKRRQYFSAGVSYGITNLQEKTRFYDRVDNVLYQDTFSINRRNTSFNLKLGRQYVTGRFVFDLAIGAGIKHRHVTHKDRSIPYGENRHYNVISSANDERNEVTFNLPATFKIGYRF